MNKLFFLLFISLVLSCNDDKKTPDSPVDVQVVVDENKAVINEMEKVFLNGKMISTPQPETTLFLYDSNLYYVRQGLDASAINSRYFLHILEPGKDQINKDFNGKDHVFLQGEIKGKSMSILKVPVNEFTERKDIATGRLLEQGREYTSYFKYKDLSKPQFQYDNRYAGVIGENMTLSAFENALDDGVFFKNPNGFDLLYLDDTLYYIKMNASQEELKNRFFLHVNVASGEQKNLDFNRNQFDISTNLKAAYPSLTVIKRDLSEYVPTAFSTGQIDSQGRSWSIVFKIDELLQKASWVYDNQYELN